MGCCVNPKNELKDVFLLREGTAVRFNISWDQVPQGMLPVVLVNNGSFIVAAVAYDAQELKRFQDPYDPRPMVIFVVPIEKLWAVSDLALWLKHEGG